MVYTRSGNLQLFNELAELQEVVCARNVQHFHAIKSPKELISFTTCENDCTFEYKFCGEIETLALIIYFLFAAKIKLNL